MTAHCDVCSEVFATGKYKECDCFCHVKVIYIEPKGNKRKLGNGAQGNKRSPARTKR